MMVMIKGDDECDGEDNINHFDGDVDVHDSEDDNHLSNTRL